MDSDWLAFIGGLIVGIGIGFAISYVMKNEAGLIIERDENGRIVGLIPAVGRQ